MLNFALFTLLTASAAYGQCSGDVKVSNQDELSKYASCESFNGTLTLSSTFRGNAVISGIKIINGDLRIEGADNLISFHADSIGEITKVFYLKSLTRLSTLSAKKLTKVGSIQWTTLPALTGLNFDAGLSTATSVEISDTFLTSLKGISLNEVDNLNLNNNRFLKKVDLDLKNIRESMTIAFNGQNGIEMIEASFPNLLWANNMTLRNVGKVSFPKLVAVNKSVAFVSNKMATLEITNLTTIGESLSLVSNDALTKVSFPALNYIGGGFQIANNSQLLTIDGFNKVHYVGGAVDFSGIFKEASLPELSNVKGGFNLQTKEKFDCEQFNDLNNNKRAIEGEYLCIGQVNDPTTKDGSISSKSGTSPDTGSSKGAAANLVASGSVCILGVLVAIFL